MTEEPQELTRGGESVLDLCSWEVWTKDTVGSAVSCSIGEREEKKSDGGISKWIFGKAD